MNDSLRAAIVNWVWLADLPAQHNVVAIGDCTPETLQGLEKHFATVKVVQRLGEQTPLPIETQSVDCVVFDEALGETVVSRSAAGGSVLLREAKRVLRQGGCLFVPVTHLRRRRPGTLMKPLLGAGFTDIRPFYVFQSFDCPNTLVPVRRRTTTFFESWAWSGTRGMIKTALAMVGSHHLTQPALFYLAYA